MLRDRLLNLIGPLPEKVDLDPKILEESDCKTFIRKKVEYNVEGGERVKAYLCHPRDISVSKPAIFCHHQHDGNWVIGKSEPAGLIGNADMFYAKELAERGFVTITPDSLGFEERNTNPYAGIDILNAYAHEDEFIHRLLVGYTLFAKAWHDISVAIDYVQSLEFVEKEKIGFIGHSFGGYMALFIPAFEQRIKAAVSNCGSFTFRNSIDGGYSVIKELCIPGIANTCDVDEVVGLIAPRSLLISTTKNDSWSNSAELIFDTAKDTFPDSNLELKVHDADGHVFTKEMRNYAYNFLDVHLNKPNSVNENKQAGNEIKSLASDKPKLDVPPPPSVSSIK